MSSDSDVDMYDYGDLRADGHDPSPPVASVTSRRPTVAAGNNRNPTPVRAPAPPSSSQGGQRSQAGSGPVTPGPGTTGRPVLPMFGGPVVNITPYRPTPPRPVATPGPAPAPTPTPGPRPLAAPPSAPAGPVFGTPAANVTRALPLQPLSELTFYPDVLRKSPPPGSQAPKRPPGTRPGGLCGTPAPAKKPKPSSPPKVVNTPPVRGPPVQGPPPHVTSHFVLDTQDTSRPRDPTPAPDPFFTPTPAPGTDRAPTLFGPRPGGRPSLLGERATGPPPRFVLPQLGTGAPNPPTVTTTTQPQAPPSHTGSRLPPPGAALPEPRVTDSAVRRRLFMAGIESIRRPQPLYQGRAVRCRVAQQPRATGSATAALPAPTPVSTDPVDVVSDAIVAPTRSKNGEKGSQSKQQSSKTNTRPVDLTGVDSSTETEPKNRKQGNQSGGPPSRTKLRPIDLTQDNSSTETKPTKRKPGRPPGPRPAKISSDVVDLTKDDFDSDDVSGGSSIHESNEEDSQPSDGTYTTEEEQEASTEEYEEMEMEDRMEDVEDDNMDVVEFEVDDDASSEEEDGDADDDGLQPDVDDQYTTSPASHLRGGGGGAAVPSKTKPKKKTYKKPEDELEPLSFYGRDATEDNTRFQDREKDRGVIPHPKAKRLLIDQLNDELNLKKRVPKWGEHTAARALDSEWATNFEEAFRDVWLPDAYRPCPILRGLPLVEDVDFFRAANHEDTGNCYWRSVAYHIYGVPDFWPRVKQEHLDHMTAVLQNPEHPRHAVYTRMNRDFYSVSVTPALQHLDANILLNTYQILKARGAWTPASMTTITADLYGVYVILFSLNERNQEQPVVTEMRTEGVYNARHIAMVYSGAHFQPITPNDHFGWEFQFPRLTREVAKELPMGENAVLERNGKPIDGIHLQWRRQFGKAVAPPHPVDHCFNASTIAMMLSEVRKEKKK